MRSGWNRAPVGGFSVFKTLFEQIRRPSRGAIRITLALALVVGASVLFWASRDYAVIAPDWDGQVRGLAYSPSHTFTTPQVHKIVSPERIDEDMAAIAQVTNRVRTYTVADGMEKVPEIARRYGLTVSLGIWIGNDLDKNEKEIETGIKVALANRRTIDRVFVGNEAILRDDVTANQLNDYIRRVRDALPNRIKVSTAEPWSTWLLTPEIGQYVDFIGIQLLPYWEGIAPRGSFLFMTHAMQHVRDEFPDRPIVVTEVGWPSEGRTNKYAEASLANEAYFVRAFVQFAMEQGWDYYIMEAFDQPGKAGAEGSVGAYWGLFAADGSPKFAFRGMLRTFPEWRAYATIAAIITLLLGLLILRRMPRVRQTGYFVMGALVALITTGFLSLIDATTLEYIHPGDLAMIFAMMPLVFLASAVILTEGIELASSLWRVEKRSVTSAIPEKAPFVSIHVPCYNEPPDMVMETLNALTRLDYENFEVLVYDNNTKDEATWRPVQEHCARLGSRFRFFHEEGVKGFKAGALNNALELTNPDAVYIAVIDSDYQVAPFWLRRMLPFFASPKIALVQGPQDYRDGNESFYKSMCYEEYRGFFHIGMVERNEHDAIIQHGTMTIVRKDALKEAGGWSTWCITEDTELGLKLFEMGYSAAYIPQSMGKGLIPDTLDAFITQRFRWVYGAMQMMKHHARPIFLGDAKLSWAQRYQFLSGWLPWISDGIGMLLTFFALVWTVLMAVQPQTFAVPMPALSAAALALFSAKTVKTLLLYPQKVRSGVSGAVMASVAGLALTHTVGKAVISGILTKDKPFFRTPKCENPSDLRQALKVVWQEATLFTLCIAALIATFLTRGLADPAAVLWMVMLGVQSLPYAASLATAAFSALAAANSSAAPVIPITPQRPEPQPELPKAA
jgi:exo-beta-1,3-glucanase (GH17 family)/cellulose synthase/poly-beta-1,6-N-acetylglucosamine synthase-like glycosyltransferase